jgi:AcrR family transcriptional regulator
MARDTRRTIIDATLSLLDEGDGDFTYERLATRAGLSRQTLYTHFPQRAELLVAAVDHVRSALRADELVAPVYSAATARSAVRELIRFHLAYTPQIIVPSRAMEAQRAAHPELSEAFEQRPSGRRQIVRHVMTRLRAEGDLVDDWSIDDATDFVSALMTAAFTSDLLDERRWTIARLDERLQQTIERTLLVAQPAMHHINKGEP